MNTVHLRDANHADQRVIESLLTHANREFETEGGAVRNDDLDVLFARLHIAQIILAEHENSAVGCVAYFPPAIARSTDDELDALLPRGHAYIGWLAVTPPARGHGIGRVLVTECIIRARRDAAHAIDLFTEPYMVAAQRLYEQFGFERRVGHKTPSRQIAYRIDL